MPIATGDKIPDEKVMVVTPEGFEPAQTGELLGKGKVVVFGLPGAFTPTCSDHHLPGFVLRAEDLKAKGVDTIACVSVNDAFVMKAWGQTQDVGDKVVLVADGNGDFTRAMDLVFDGSGIGLGSRSKRYAAIIEDGIITSLNVETKPGLDVSSAETILAAL
jgi:glutaredoxin/glutathione-dependent peroxiredoxin